MYLAALAAALALASPSALPDEPPASAGASAPDAPAPAEATPPAAPPAVTPDRPAASAPPPAPAEAPAARPTGLRRGGGSRFGLLVDGGLPQGTSLSVAFRPVPSVRFFAGPAWNVVGFGVQGGLSIAPWHFAVTPLLTAEAGRYFGADLSFVAKGGQGVPPEIRGLLKSTTYTYGALLAGLEFGSQDGFAFDLALGLSYVALDATGTVTKTDATSGATVTFKDPRVRATLPSLKLGFHYWF